MSGRLSLIDADDVFVDSDANQQEGTQCCGDWLCHADVRRFGGHKRILAGLLEFEFW